MTVYLVYLSLTALPHTFRQTPVAFAGVAELGLLAVITVLLPLGGALEDEEEEDRPPSTESSSSKFLSVKQK